uniref:Uncharacterized protein n=1 Tax=Anguilla anguilla TaxID=7936 RepID=A0A0E9UMB0_ANGAN
MSNQHAGLGENKQKGHWLISYQSNSCQQRKAQHVQGCTPERSVYSLKYFISVCKPT